ncbi:hypothetical protein JCM14244_11190 [Venenivibrio stagnispumantis]|uniref:DUF4325 domain-containing protein n=1 Tax=Venenivibrio stagnispumantis TaxID=407998 RepID=A0AA45WND3_9AQUI|nr:STAS-like domain-containing protein [Venenivibrio stagnispumantis]MCW4573182.1 STAS-like domain-containing protein [Venenivibrio stagnispumantis]SMP17770.1 protein of unknown function [Venenivibrio stagnispumantis]
MIKTEIDVNPEKTQNVDTNILKIKDLFDGLDALTLRIDGLKVRKIMENILKKNEVVILDFEGINLITQGFGDEIIGVFVRNKGIDFVKNKIKVRNANDLVRGILNWVVSYSKNIS